MVADALSTVDKTSLDANHSASPYALSGDAVVSDGSTTLAGTAGLLESTSASAPATFPVGSFAFSPPHGTSTVGNDGTVVVAKRGGVVGLCEPTPGTAVI